MQIIHSTNLSACCIALSFPFPKSILQILKNSDETKNGVIFERNNIFVNFRPNLLIILFVLIFANNNKEINAYIIMAIVAFLSMCVQQGFCNFVRWTKILTEKQQHPIFSQEPVTCNSGCLINASKNHKPHS